MTILGTDENGKNVEISLTERLTSVYCLGATGSGKTTLLEQMIVQDIERGVGVCLLDPHSDLTDKLINRIPKDRLDDVILLDPLDTDYPFGLNLYECPDNTDPKMVAYTLNNVMDTFEKLYDMSRATPRMAQVMRNLAYLLIYNPGMTMLEIPRILSDQEFRSRLVSNLPPHLLPFWQRYDRLRPAEQIDFTDSSLNKIDEFITDPILYPIFGQSHTTVSFRDIMDSTPGKPGKILLIRLARELSVMTSLIGSFLTGQLLIAALSRKDTQESKRRLYCLFCDEFQNFSTPSMSTLLTEARKYKIASHLFHQTRFQPGITDEIRSITMQAGSLIIFRVNPDDAKELAPAFNLTPPEAVKPQPTIPRDAFNYLSRHPNEVVKDFAGGYILRLQNALRKKEKRETIPDMGSYEYDPYHNFGEGETSFKPDQVQNTLNNIETLLYETMRQETIPEKELMQTIVDMAPLLQYEYYDTCYYLQDTSDYEESEKAIRSKADALIAEKETEITELVKQIALNDYDLAWYLFGENRKKTKLVWHFYCKNGKTKEAVWECIVEDAATNRRDHPTSAQEMFDDFKNRMYEKYRGVLQKWAENRTTHREAARKFKWRPIPPRYPDENRELIGDYIDDDDYDSQNYRFITVATLRQAVSSDDALFAFIATHEEAFSKKSKEEIWAMSVKSAESNKRLLASSRPGTPEGIMRIFREQLEKELTKLQNEVMKAKADRDTRLAWLLQNHQSELGVAKDRHDRFKTQLVQVLHILKTPKGKIEVPSTEWHETLIVQQSYTERQNQVANELVQFPVGRARVKLPTGEYLLTTIVPQTSKKDFAAKKEQIIDQTRRKYCTPRREVEEQIRQRQHQGPQLIRKYEL
jgi:Type IV secretion-system coupling protein DNA-binding domain